MVDAPQTTSWILRGTGEHATLRFPLGEGGNTVGSRRENHVCLDGPGISKRHAILRVQGEHVTVEDLASKNGTLVNGRRVGHATLAAGDTVGFAALTLRLDRVAADDAHLAIHLEAPRGSEESAFQETPWMARDAPARASALPETLVFPDDWLPGDSPAMRHLLAQVRLVAGSELPVLVLGETGVGKEGLAQTLHRSSSRSLGPFVAINCAAIPEQLLEAELFGIGRGVATGVQGRPGRFLEAQGGTLFLDEIGDLPSALQAKLLRVLQEGEVEPVGQAPRKLDVRLVAATHTDLGAAMAEGRFRRDLFYRLAGVTLQLPPLRQRREDIPGLVAHFLAQAVQTAGKDVRGVTAAALQRLSEHPWPGNVRQLRHTVERCVLRCPDHQVLDAEAIATDLASGVDGAVSPAPPSSEPDLSNEASPFDPKALPSLDLATLERQVIREALRRSGGHLTHAAASLGLTRQALRRRMKRHGLRDADASGE